MSDCFCGGGIDRLNQLTVMLRGLDAMPAHQFSNGAVWRLALSERSVHRIEIVLANEKYGEPMNRGEVHTLVENAGLDRRVAEKNGSDSGTVLQHRAKRRTDPDGNGAADNRHAAQEIDREVDEVHRAALARRAPVHLAVKLREHGAQAAAFADVVSMRAVRADDVVFRAQMPADASSHRFLADAEMRGTAHITLRIEVLDALLHPPDF